MEVNLRVLRNAVFIGVKCHMNGGSDGTRTRNNQIDSLSGGAKLGEFPNVFAVL